MSNTEHHSTPSSHEPPRRFGKSFEWIHQVIQTMDLGLFSACCTPRHWDIRKWIRVAVLLAVIAFALAWVRHGVVHVRENQVCVMVNNLTHNLELKDSTGYHFFIPYLTDFYIFDKTVQKMDLTWSTQMGSTPRDIKLKTRDGNNVSLDITLNFKLIPEKAVTVLTHSGQDMQFAELWLESYTRQICLETFGELSTEEMYDALHRNAKAQECLVKINHLLEPQGIEVIAFISGDIRFYREYENVIQEKKLADQQVEEQQSQALASLSDQKRRIVEEQKKAEVRLQDVEGENKNRMIKALSDAMKTRLSAEQSYQTQLRLADALLYSASASAEGLRATKIAEAEGMEKLRESLIGEGGLGIIGLEYTRRLNEIRFSGSPITRDPHLQQFSVQQNSGASIFNPNPPANRGSALGGNQ
jgi:regulator of protease activity HflC (stomatin/prohibitin superfamily)